MTEKPELPPVVEPPSSAEPTQKTATSPKPDARSSKEIAADFIEGFLDLAEYNGDIEIHDIDGHPVVKIITDETDTDINDLVGKNGITLRALEQLVSMVIRNKTDEDTYISLDIANFKQKISEKYLADAQKAIDQVKQTGIEVQLEPMNSYNRRLVHRLVSDQGLNSSSEGSEPNRYLTILPTAATPTA
jgi:spoIIIJ-associated protein